MTDDMKENLFTIAAAIALVAGALYIGLNLETDPCKGKPGCVVLLTRGGWAPVQIGR